MEHASLITLGDLRDLPRVLKALPSPLRVGDVVLLDFTLRRRNGSRTDELVVHGNFRVSQVSFDARGSVPRQLVTVEAVQVAPAWRSVKNIQAAPRKLSPAVAPRTVIS